MDRGCVDVGDGVGGDVGNGSGVKFVGRGDEPEVGDGEEQVHTDMFSTPVGDRVVETGNTVVGSNHVGEVDNLEEPRVGMVFNSWIDVENYYKQYAEQQGFWVSRVAGVSSKVGVRQKIACTWRCECWGRPDMRAVREAKKRAKDMEVAGSVGKVGDAMCVDELRRRKRKSKKCECEAMIYAGRTVEGDWVIRKVVLEHLNHSPKPEDAQLVKEYRMKKLTSNVRRKLLHFFDEGVPVSQILGCLELGSNGDNGLKLTVKDLQHEVYKARRLRMVGGDSTAMMAYFEKMQANNQNFYHAQRLDEFGRLKDVFWVDARSRAAYEEFGDVVCFDATYLTNQYDLPFVNFVGVNHHGHSILLGCGLLSHEDCETFTWLFKQWLCCMNNRAPLAILTDQAAAMRKPLEETMPGTRHRWCIWHIMKKIPEKLGKCEGYADLKKEMKAVVYESLNVQEFEERWIAFIGHYKLETNDWLNDLYGERHMWVPAFMREYFWAGMKTTQRVESINSFFDGFLNRNTKLYEFPEKYSKAMKKRVSDETDADANCSKYLRRLATGYKVERIFQKLYTDRKFQELQTECIRMNYCCPREETKISESVTQYVLEDRVWIVVEGSNEEIITDRRRYYCATFNKETTEVSCECRKFETHGIMCKHMIRVLDLNHVYDIPSRYILNRWRKDILRKHTLVKVAYHDPAESVEVKRHKKLMSLFEPICDVAAMVDDETVDLVVKGLVDLENKVLKRRQMKLEQTVAMNFSGEANSSVQKMSDGCGNTGSVQEQNTGDPDSQSRQAYTSTDVYIADPVTKKRGRGRPKGSRNKTLQEIGYKLPSKKKGKKQASSPSTCDMANEAVVEATNKLTVTRSRTSKNKNSGPAATSPTVGLDHIPEDDVLLNCTWDSQSMFSQSF